MPLKIYHETTIKRKYTPLAQGNTSPTLIHLSAIRSSINLLPNHTHLLTIINIPRKTIYTHYSNHKQITQKQDDDQLSQCHPMVHP